MEVGSQLFFAFFLWAAICPGFLLAQKVKVDYDKSVDFAKYKTYTWGQLDPARNPLLRVNIVGAIDEQLAAKGLSKVETNGDLVVTYVGALTGGEASQGVGAPTYPGYAGPPPTVDATMWSGSGGAGMTATYPEGTLVAELMDPHAAKITWRAVGSLKIDMDKKDKSLNKINELIAKMFARYPPEKK